MRSWAGLLAVVGLAAADASSASASVGSPLALARVSGGERPQLILAQRAIEREWPARGDSAFVWFEGQRSEIAALALSAALPGAGQLYAGERRGIVFAAAEALGWLGWLFLRGDAKGLRDDARAFAGSPDDSASAWSFARWEESTQGDATDLRRLYAADREAFEERIAGDSRYAAGWSSAAALERYGDLRHRADRRLIQARTTEGALWVNHVLAALDAVRAVRMHNLPLRSGVELKAHGGWAHGGPVVRLTLERRF